MSILQLFFGYYFNEFAKLFTQFNLVSVASIVIGIMLIVIEFNQNYSRKLYIFGAIFLAMGIVVRLLYNGSFFIAFILILFISFILFVTYFLFLLKNKKAWLIKASTLSINLELSDGKNNYSFLLGLEGDAKTDINPQGHISINDINFFVTSEDNSLIPSGRRVVVTSADSEKIYVKAMEPEEINDLNL